MRIFTHPEHGTRDIHVVRIVHMNVGVGDAGPFVVRDHLVLGDVFDALAARLPRQGGHNRALRRAFVTVEIILRELHDVVIVGRLIVLFLLVLQLLQFALYPTLAPLLALLDRLLLLRL